MVQQIKVLIISNIVIFSLLGYVDHVTANALTEEQLVEKARHTIETFSTKLNWSLFKNKIKDAKALLIIPQQFKMAFLLGADGGRGVALVKDKISNEWSEPGFYTHGGVSFGIQFGAQSSEIVIMVMTDSAVEKLYSSSFKMGGDLSIAAGLGGGGFGGSTSSNLGRDFLSFSRSGGIFAGISLEGTILASDDYANETYYGKSLRPSDIFIKQIPSNKHSARLKKAVAILTEGS